jgi:hypothetical protein
MGRFEYRVQMRLPSGRRLRTAPYYTPTERHVGDLVRLPVRPDGELQPGERYAWRVAAVEEGGRLLVLEFDRAA